MTETTVGTSTALPAAVWRQLEEICNRFEKAWQQAGKDGPPPDLANYLPTAAAPVFSRALPQLILLDADYRRDRGEPPPLQEYHRRFPEIDTAWLAAALTETPGEGVPTEPVETAGQVNGSEPSRYRIIRRHAAGGLGEIYVASDQQLKRQVALKRIRQDNPDAALHRDRFLLEAEITGGLEHPGVVPVYSLDHFIDGQPFYAMRFVQGDDLKKAIEDFHHPDKAATDAGERRVAFQQLLRRFLDVCNVVAYAHSRGVLHRDIKPENVMLREFGETLLVDWGLAKPTGESDSDAERGKENDSAFWPEAAHAVMTTQAGFVKGTPAFMSPEQAAGEMNLRPATDIYGLGATLYCLLTGTTPYAGSVDVLAAVRGGRLTPPRQVCKSVPPALEAICLKAMQLRPEDRYRSARALADDVEHWLADEPVSAYPEPWRDRARRWLRRHRTFATSAAAVLVAAAVLSGSAAMMLNAAWGRERVARQDEERHRKEAEESKNEAEYALAFLVTAFRSPDPRLDGSNIKVVEMLNRAVEDWHRGPSRGPRAEARLLHAFGETYRGMGLFSRAVELHDRALKFRFEHLGKHHPDTIVSMNNLGLSLYRAGRPLEALPILEESYQAFKGKYGPDHADTINGLNNVGLAYAAIGRRSEAKDCFQESHMRGKATLGLDHEITVQAMFNLSDVLRSNGQFADAIALAQEVLNRREGLLGREHPDTLLAMQNLAVVYKQAGQVSKALPIFERLLAPTKTKLGDDHSETLVLLNNLGMCYQALGRLAESLPYLKKCYERSLMTLGPKHNETLGYASNLALIYRELGEIAESVRLYEGILSDSIASLGEDHPQTLIIMNNLAVSYAVGGRNQDAFKLTQRVYERRLATLGATHPNTLTSMNNLARSYEELGRIGPATSLMEEALRLRRTTLGSAHPATVGSMCSLGQMYMKAGSWDKADVLLAEALVNLPKESPKRAAVLHLLGRCKFEQGKSEDAEPVLRECLIMRAKLADHLAQSETEILLGAVLTARKQYAPAEELLLTSYGNLRANHPLGARASRVLDDNVLRIIALYESWGKVDKTGEWRAKREERQRAAKTLECLRIAIAIIGGWPAAR